MHQLEIERMTGMLLDRTVMRRAIAVRVRGRRVLLSGCGEERAFLATLDAARTGWELFVALHNRCQLYFLARGTVPAAFWDMNHGCEYRHVGSNVGVDTRSRLHVRVA